MTIQLLADACVDSLNHPERSKPNEPFVRLVGKKGGLFPRKGWPKPVELLCINSRGGYTYLYDAASVLAAMAAHGLIEVKS